ncbi:CDP-archaeol synthase [Methylohalobius crimeensis]|uniref:CDP-archaeol synthase n=1 Tax=Methylohalobius crimeensis TaxID=244365 RepID=UPI0003B30D77|nr:CDP-archaeol synthase [Methylohalobius crimeensis]
MATPCYHDGNKNKFGDAMLEIKLLILLLVANGAPVVAWDLFKERFAWPVDCGAVMPDGRFLLGPAKTWRGLLASLFTTGITAPLIGFPWTLGAWVAAAAMAGDLLSSFVKRRLGVQASDTAPGLDQIPESLLPLWAVNAHFALGWDRIGLLVAVFYIAEVSLSPLLYRLGIRKRPY